MTIAIAAGKPSVETEIIRRIAAQLNVDGKNVVELERNIVRAIHRLQECVPDGRGKSTIRIQSEDKPVSL